MIRSEHHRAIFLLLATAALVVVAGPVWAQHPPDPSGPEAAGPGSWPWILGGIIGGSLALLRIAGPWIERLAPKPSPTEVTLEGPWTPSREDWDALADDVAQTKREVHELREWHAPDQTGQQHWRNPELATMLRKLLELVRAIKTKLIPE